MEIWKFEVLLRVWAWIIENVGAIQILSVNGMSGEFAPRAQGELGAALFISYDGLTDPLGGSQILPYIRSISSHPRRVHILSVEKPDRFASGGETLAVQLAAEGIGWTPLSFSKGGKLAKVGDLAQMYVAAVRLLRRDGFRIIHCRSYQAAQVGRLLKRAFGARILFDMRGLWVDERIDGGIWSLRRPLDYLAYRYYKRVERGLLRDADHIVALTHRVVPELCRIAPAMRAGVTVIPCCADFTHFRVLSKVERSSVRHELGIPENAFVISYLGSLGTWYCLDQMFDAFLAAVKRRPDAHLLMITRDWTPGNLERFVHRGGAALKDRLHIRAGTRAEVPQLIGAADVMLSFIKPAYSKMASSPTKLAEAFACGVPAICNPGIGDVDTQLVEIGAGALLDLSKVADVEDVIRCLAKAQSVGGAALRERARAVLDMPVAAAAYRHVYNVVDPA